MANPLMTGIISHDPRDEPPNHQVGNLKSRGNGEKCS